MSGRPAAAAAGWVRRRERGSLAAMRLGTWILLRLGWRGSRWLVWGIATYFLATAPAARAASARFLTAALGRPAGWRDTARHILSFASAIQDRVYLLAGRHEGYDIRVSGREHLEARIAAGQGCILLGSHLGSFEALRAVADRGCPVPVRALMYPENAARANAVLGAINPDRAADVIPIGGPGALLRVKEALDAGELVGILGDRIVSGDKVVAAGFLGRDALFPAGPVVLAAVLKAPVLLCQAVRTGPRRYEVRFEPFAERIVLGSRRTREADVTAWVARYARALEAAARDHPYDWFNFYDFWDGPDDDRAALAASPRRRRRRLALLAGRCAALLGGGGGLRHRGAHGRDVAGPGEPGGVS